MSVNSTIIDRIDNALPRVPADSTDLAPLTYIREQLQPERLRERADNDVLGEDNSDTLRSVAEQRLRPYEKENN